MADGLEFLLELDAKLGPAQDLMRVLQQLDSTLKKVDDGLRKVEHSTKKHGDAAKHTGGILNNFLHAILHPLHTKLGQIAEFEFIRRGVDWLLESPKEALHLFTELFEKMIEVAAEAERTSMSFKLLFGAKEGQETLDWIDKIGKHTEFTQATLKGAAQKLGTVGFKGHDLKLAMEAAADMASFNPDKQAGFAEALSSLERVKRTGKVTDRMLGGLGLGEGDFYKVLSEQTGEGIKALKKKIDAGKGDVGASFDALATLITRRTKKDLGGASVAMSTSLDANLTHLKEMPTRLMEPLKDSKGFGAVKDFTGKLNEALDPESASGKKLITALTLVMDKVGQILAKVDVNKLVADITRLVAVLERLLGALDRFTGVRAPSVNGQPGAFTMPKATTGVSGKMETGWDWFRRLVPHAIQPGPMVNKWMGGVLDDLDKKGQGAGSQYAAGTAKGVEVGSPAVAASGWSMVDNLADVTAAKSESHSPSRLFERLGRSIGDGFNDGIQKSTSGTDDIVAGAFAVPAPAGGQRGGNTISVEIHTTVHASGDGQHIAQEVSQQIREIIPGALQSAFEQLANQAGSA